MIEHYYRIFNKVFSTGEPTVRNYEVACLHAFWSVLDVEERLIFEGQLKRYDRVQRSTNGKHLGFFDNESDSMCTTWPHEALFTFRSNKPVALVEITLSFADINSKVKAQIFVYAGRFAGIEFLQMPPPHIHATTDVRLQDVRIQHQVDDLVVECVSLLAPEG